MQVLYDTKTDLLYIRLDERKERSGSDFDI